MSDIKITLTAFSSGRWGGIVHRGTEMTVFDYRVPHNSAADVLREIADWLEKEARDE